jgi:thiol:disulfide interchange protein DsbC
MNKIWCADDRLAAMDSAINGRDMDSAACATPVLNQLALGQQLGVNGTPAILTAEGALMPGYVPADRLLPMLGIK